MSNQVPTTWMVRCEGGELFDDFVEGRFFAIGDRDNPQPHMGAVVNREEIANAIRNSAQYSDARLRYATGVLSRFILEMQTSDRALTYDPSQRVYAVGSIAGPYQHALDRLEGKQHFREVEWLERRISRDALTPETRQELTSWVSVFELSERAAAELDSLVNGQGPEVIDGASSPVGQEENTRRQIAEEARELVKDAVVRLQWDQLQDLVAGILRAMGYKTRVSAPGGDRGRDILASPDGLGLEHPRILVEVKHRPATAISGPDVRSFVGGLRSSDRGLYVSTGGFTKDAKYEADRSSVPLTLLDADELVKLLLEHYEKADARLRTLIPLVPVFWPADA